MEDAANLFTVGERLAPKIYSPSLGWDWRVSTEKIDEGMRPWFAIRMALQLEILSLATKEVESCWDTAAT